MGFLAVFILNLIQLGLLTPVLAQSHLGPLADPHRSSQTVQLLPEYAPVTSLFIGTTERMNLSAIYQQFLDHVPPEVQIVFLTKEAPSQVLSALQKHKRGFKTLIVEPTVESLWLRDSLPIPLTSKDSQQRSAFSFQYFGGPTAATKVAQLLDLTLTSSQKIFEGGNLVADGKGNCFAIEMLDLGQDGQIPTEDLKLNLSCNNIQLLPFIGGIGHADERLIFLSDNLAATDTEEIATVLSQLGYTVLLLPSIANSTFTYMNAVLINGVLFVPQFGIETDFKALEIYKKTGLKVVPVASAELTTNGAGSLHCITRTYP